MPSVTFEHVSKRFGDTVIIDDFNLEVADGELLVLVGGSGSGKSTILRMLAGLETVSSGTIRIGERDVTSLPPRERDVAMVFQDYALYPHMTVRENLSLGLRLKKTPRAEIDRRITWAAGMLGLDALLDRKPKALSGGQRQRVAMGRAIVREPSVFLFDEPLSNLDASLRAQMRMEIGSLQRRLGTTSVYVTHDQVEAMTLGHRIVVLANHIVQQVGAPIELYRAPVNRFVAGFIGTPPMNFFDGTIVRESGKRVFITESVRQTLSADLPDQVADGASLTLGVRPEDFIRTSGEGSEEYEMPDLIHGNVLLVERLGGSNHVHVDVNGQRIVAVLGNNHLPDVGRFIALRALPERVHLFDKAGVAIR